MRDSHSRLLSASLLFPPLEQRRKASFLTDDAVLEESVVRLRLVILLHSVP